MALAMTASQIYETKSTRLTLIMAVIKMTKHMSFCEIQLRSWQLNMRKLGIRLLEDERNDLQV